MTKFLNTILILIILVAGAKLVMQGREYRALAQERKQLVEKLDGFHVRDPSKYLVQSVDTDDPMLFMWRVHKPGGFETGYLGKYPWGKPDIFGAGGSLENKLELVSVRFEFDEDLLWVDMQTARGGCRSRTHDTTLVAICQQHWDDLEIEVSGQEAAVEIDTNQEVVLLSVKIPKELLNKLETEKTFGKDLDRRFPSDLIYRISFGQSGMLQRSKQRWQGGRR